MIFQHSILAILWITYCVVHSLFASIRVKIYLEEKLGYLFRYYRLSYSLFATITLVFIVYYQFSITSILLFKSSLIGYLSLILFVIPGFILMLISIYKYFRLLSGIRALYHKKEISILRVEGIHKYIRHPLYSGTLLFISGIFFIFPFLSNFIAVFIIALYVIVGVRLEEKKLLLEFGDSYKAYRENVPMLIPNFKKTSNKKGGRFGHP